MPVTISGTAGITYPAGGLANTVGAGVGTSDTQTLTNKTLTTPNIDSAQIPTVSGTAPLYMCRAWVNFNGTGTVAIRASGNVTNITDNGIGDYTVNITTAMTDANYCVVCTTSLESGQGSARIMSINLNTVMSTTAVRTQVSNDSGTPDDKSVNCVSIFR